MFCLAEDHRVTAQAAASRNPEGGLDFYVRLRGLQSGAHAQLVSRYCSGAVNAGRGVSTARSNATFGRSVARKITPQTRKNSRMTQTNPEIAGAARFFSSLLERLVPISESTGSETRGRYPSASVAGAGTGAGCRVSAALPTASKTFGAGRGFAGISSLAPLTP